MRKNQQEREQEEIYEPHEKVLEKVEIEYVK